MGPVPTTHLRSLAAQGKAITERRAERSHDSAPLTRARLRTPIVSGATQRARRPVGRRWRARAKLLWRSRRSAPRWLMTQSFAPHWLPASLRRPAFGYVTAILMQFIAVGFTSVILAALPHFAFTGLLSVLGIVLIALTFGPGPSLLATLLGALMLNFFILTPRLHFSLHTLTDVVGFVMYVAVGVAISLVAGQVERGRRVAEGLAAQVATHASQTLALQHERYSHEREAARARVEALEASQRQMDVFLGLASHELRTPLTVALANVQIVRRQAHEAVRLLTELDAQASQTASEPSESAPQRLPAEAVAITKTLDSVRQRGVIEQKLTTIATLLDRSDAAMARLNRLVNDLLDASRIEAGRFNLTEQSSDLGALVTEAVAEQRLAWPEREIQLSVPLDAITVWGDPVRLKQVASVFLSNALKFGPPMRPVRLALECLAPPSEPSSTAHRRGATSRAASVARCGADGRPGEARITVSDAGPGLSPTQQAQVWERFTRIQGIDQQQGSGAGVGLGLYIAHAIVEQHGGRLGVESAIGEGATFWYELPLFAPPSPLAAVGDARNAIGAASHH